MTLKFQISPYTQDDEARDVEAAIEDNEVTAVKPIFHAEEPDIESRSQSVWLFYKQKERNYSDKFIVFVDILTAYKY